MELRVFAGKPRDLGAHVVALPPQVQGLGTLSAINFAVYHPEPTLTLRLFTESVEVSIKLDPTFNRTGHVWHCLICLGRAGVRDERKGQLCPTVVVELQREFFEYDYIVHGRPALDPYASAVGGGGSQTWGHARSVHHRRGLVFPFEEEFDWEGVTRPTVAHQDLVIYEMHVRGFTQHPTSNVQNPGTFLGVIEKIPHLKALGVTAVELLPVHAFDETEWIGRCNPEPQPDAQYSAFVLSSAAVGEGWKHGVCSIRCRPLPSAAGKGKAAGKEGEGEEAAAFGIGLGDSESEEEEAGHVDITSRLRGEYGSGDRLGQYWGYSTLNFMSPMPRLATRGERACVEFKTMVRELHRAGILVLLDVVYNHTGDGFHGFADDVYFIKDMHGNHHNYSGCGNTVNSNHPVVRRFILHSLRHWANTMGVDGFRFDLASALVRGVDGVPLERPPLIEAISSDPELQGTLLIAEPWDAAGLYQVGTFPHFGVWKEWNGKFRDDVRRFLKGDDNMSGAFAGRLCGSHDIYSPGGRCPLHSINFITSHDGFSLRDLVSYNGRNNLRNGENNNDGERHNLSWNCGAEGETENLDVLWRRGRQCRNALLALFLAQGIPMLTMGDECGHTRQGNNNPWCQDNELNFLDWRLVDSDDFGLVRYLGQLALIRQMHSSMRHQRFLTSEEVTWHGCQPHSPNWGPSNRVVALQLSPVLTPIPSQHFVNDGSTSPGGGGGSIGNGVARAEAAAAGGSGSVSGDEAPSSGLFSPFGSSLDLRTALQVSQSSDRLDSLCDNSGIGLPDGSGGTLSRPRSISNMVDGRVFGGGRDVYVAFNSSHVTVTVTLPPLVPERMWRLKLHTAYPPPYDIAAPDGEYVSPAVVAALARRNAAPLPTLVEADDSESGSGSDSDSTSANATPTTADPADVLAPSQVKADLISNNSSSSSSTADLAALVSASVAASGVGGDESKKAENGTVVALKRTSSFTVSPIAVVAAEQHPLPDPHAKARAKAKAKADAAAAAELKAATAAAAAAEAEAEAEAALARAATEDLLTIELPPYSAALLVARGRPLLPPAPELADIGTLESAAADYQASQLKSRNDRAIRKLERQYEEALKMMEVLRIRLTAEKLKQQTLVVEE